jgi:hypothetical protein
VDRGDFRQGISGERRGLAGGLGRHRGLSWTPGDPSNAPRVSQRFLEDRISDVNERERKSHAGEEFRASSTADEATLDASAAGWSGSGCLDHHRKN